MRLRNPFNRNHDNEYSPVEECITALFTANQFLHPEWTEHEVMFNSLHAVRTISGKRNAHKKLVQYVNEVLAIAETKYNEVKQLEQQFQLSTDNNN